MQIMNQCIGAIDINVEPIDGSIVEYDVHRFNPPQSAILTTGKEGLGDNNTFIGFVHGMHSVAYAFQMQFWNGLLYL